MYYKVVKKLVKDQLKIDLDDREISVCHRPGEKSRTQGPDKRKLIVKFGRRSTKVDVLSTARKMKARNLYVNESLTPVSQTISFVLRKMRKKFPEKISGSTTFDGKNFVWVKPSNPEARGARDLRHAITSREKLKNFSVRVLERPLTDFINDWPH